MDSQRFSLYGNTITPAQDRKALEWQKMFVDQFDYDPDEQYELSASSTGMPAPIAAAMGSSIR